MAIVKLVVREHDNGTKYWCPVLFDTHFDEKGDLVMKQSSIKGRKYYNKAKAIVAAEKMAQEYGTFVLRNPHLNKIIMPKKKEN